MIKAFPKIFAIGTDYISGIFEDEVEITEKVDGSQFVFGKINNDLFMRSKGATLYLENPQQMFQKGMEYVDSVSHLLPDNIVFYCEYLQKEKHNVLKYNNTPKNHLALYGISSVSQSFVTEYHKLQDWADKLGISVVPLLFKGKVTNIERIHSLLNTESFLGGPKIEGFVVKNYTKQFLLGGQPMPLMAGKYVSEAFKEVHRGNWRKENTGRGKWDLFKESFKTEARWHKAVQHLRDKDELQGSPRDIGSLIKEVQQDIIEEEKEEILKFLWKEFSGEVLRTSVKGLPEWYKQQLLLKEFNQ